MDFSGQNLRGRNFKGQDLTGANFSYADIRGANFTSAILQGANFTGVKAGLLPSWSACLFIVSITLSILGLGTSVVSVNLFSSADVVHWSEVIMASENPLRVDVKFPILELVIFVFCFTSIMAGQFIGEFADKTQISMELFGSSRMSRMKSKLLAKTFFICTFIIWAVFFLTETSKVIYALLLWMTLGLFPGLCLAAFIGLVFAYPISSRNVLFDGKRTIFRNSDLTDADFTRASLTYVDFRKSNLVRTCWFQAWTVKDAWIKDTYLEDLYLYRLLTTKQGANQIIYNTKKTRDINLENANLTSRLWLE
uniref:pentapeptide repeat-containing protein n=1 Tax=Trichocoleus desertorum TaxID=1481672 RepID=UPI0025B36448|nr:pentapeptide repeat-containing protein [Trichocoleus desertorum]